MSSGFWVELVPLARGCGGQASDQGGETGREPCITAWAVTLAWPKGSLESRVLGWREAPNGAQGFPVPLPVKERVRVAT